MKTFVKKLSEVPWDNLAVGDVCISVLGTPGVITDLVPIDQTSRQEDGEVEIHWENGKQSYFWHFWGDNITYVGPS